MAHEMGGGSSTLLLYQVQCVYEEVLLWNWLVVSVNRSRKEIINHGNYYWASGFANSALGSRDGGSTGDAGFAGYHRVWSKPRRYHCQHVKQCSDIYAGGSCRHAGSGLRGCVPL